MTDGENPSFRSRDERFVWGDEDDLQFSQCATCARWLGRGACEAFPDGVPDPILMNEHDHHLPYPGDRGLRFKPAKKRS